MMSQNSRIICDFSLWSSGWNRAVYKISVAAPSCIQQMWFLAAHPSSSRCYGNKAILVWIFSVVDCTFGFSHTLKPFRMNRKEVNNELISEQETEGSHSPGFHKVAQITANLPALPSCKYLSWTFFKKKICLFVCLFICLFICISTL